MTYLGLVEGVKGNLFMRSNNSIAMAETLLFDERIFPHCPDAKEN